MAYCVEADIRNQSPFKNVTNITAAYVNTKIAEASNIIDSAIGGIYVLPLSSVPLIIANLAKEITTLIIFREQGKNMEVQPGVSIEPAWNIQMALLTAVIERKQKLYDPVTNQELSLSDAAKPYSFPNASSSDPSSSSSTAPVFTMAQAQLFNKGRY